MSDAGPLVITIASLYGTDDAVIGRAVADRVGVGFLGRDEVPDVVAQRLGIPASLRAPIDEEPRTLSDRVASVLSRAPVIAAPWAPERLDVELRRYRAEVEHLLFEKAASGTVVVGRAGTVVLRSVPGVLHVRLTGPRDDRVRRVIEAQGLGRSEAERLVDAHDAARAAYGLQLYGADPADVDLYHLVVDTTALRRETVVDLIVAASGARRRTQTG